MKNRVMAIALAFFLGGLGIHRFYLNKPLSGLLYALFSWTFIPAILGVLEAFCLLVTRQKTFDRMYNHVVYVDSSKGAA